MGVDVYPRLLQRLRGQYAIGPHLPNGRPEFGIRQFEAPPIQHEAASRIEALESTIAAQAAEIERLQEALEDTTAHLVGAASAYETFAKRHPKFGKAETDALFGTRREDFRKAIVRARIALQENNHEQ